MTLAAEVKKLTESKPFYAVAGVGDYAVEKLRELPSRLEKLQSRRGELRDTALELPVKARAYAVQLPDRAKEYAEAVNARAAALYEEFAARGRRVVSRVSGDAALELEEVSESAVPATAAKTTPKRAPRTTKTTTAKR
ncbi:hypothetical protein [Thermostaphylospora chromogena]|uniref:Uncharacterized protein n=1 Tax=Thermostaphylospora chromogena TaxID=35622 RepID=A0A1H1DX73_9ACTN|nr:hypothetical protein [Thermostaphylospora chromogena]SDQ81142.1 hypothetical protein SAMN04489764_2213 [Thermostaphylospora chromogena]